MAAEREAKHAGEGGIELPSPTPWPLLAAFGMTLGFAGLVTHPIVSMVGGVCFLFGGVGWWREVLPVAHEIEVPLAAPARRARLVEPVPETVDHLELGEGGHRMRLPTHVFPLSAGIRGGIAGGIAMAALAELYGLLVHQSLWYPVNLLSAAAIPSLANASTEQLAQFSTEGLLVGVIVHVLFSLLVGLLYAVMLPMFPRHPAILGGIVAPLLWTGLLWTSLGVINPALNERIAWGWFAASQLAFGLAAGFVVSKMERIATLQSAAFAIRAGLELQYDEEGKE
ncbi:MAG: hypothetical protein FJ144_04395 [Deltaproteobacteria bacterium]|nr:hypothetical protein [Deltaproteobacteria bacterium]